MRLTDFSTLTFDCYGTLIDWERGILAELRPYQREGLSWLALLHGHRLGGILADDMGLGKTLQLLALVQYAREQGETRPFLVVAPTSVCQNGVMDYVLHPVEPLTFRVTVAGAF